MDFELTADQQMLQDTLRRFVSDHVIPHARSWDQQGALPRTVIDALAGMGMLGVTTPLAWQGAGLGYTELALIVEEVARGDGSLALLIASHNGLCAGHMGWVGTPDQKERYLKPLAQGVYLGAWALTEPNSGSDAAAMGTTAVRHGDRWILHGSKLFVTQGTCGDVYVVLAQTDTRLGSRGITAFIIEKDTPGFERRAMGDKLGMRASDTALLNFDHVELSDAQRLGQLNQGFIDARHVLDRGRITLGALAVGLGRAALEDACAYAAERQQFGQPIACFEAIQGKLATMATELQAARLLIGRAAWRCDTHQPFSHHASMAKLLASEVAMRATEEGIQIHGGYGYMAEFGVERYWRDAKLCTIGEGTSEVQRMIIARHVLKGMKGDEEIRRDAS